MAVLAVVRVANLVVVGASPSKEVELVMSAAPVGEEVEMVVVC